MVRVALLSLLFAQAAFGLTLQKRAVAYFDPHAGGGSLLDNAGSGGGEPLNVIISGLSSPAVLTDAGALNFARSIGFSTECFGIHLGDPQSANLGDGNGWVNQTVELRQDYGDANVGTCLESLIGGNHFRIYRQNGPLANSGALFLAKRQVPEKYALKTFLTNGISKDESQGHTIVANGYNIGRDKLVSAAVGSTSYKGVNYQTTEEDISGLLAPGSAGVNHGIATDGIVKLLTVTIV